MVYDLHVNQTDPMARFTITTATTQLQDVGITLNEFIDWLRENHLIFSQTALDLYLAD